MKFIPKFLLIALTLSMVSPEGLAAREPEPPENAARPNIIWIFADDHAFQALSAYGGRLADAAPTPNIDRLAEMGMRFNRGYVANSICAPARANILTGQHSHVNGVLTNRGESGKIDYSRVTTFPQLLQEAGYTTGIMGKWHLKNNPRGFDEWAVLPGQGSYYHPHFIVPDPENPGQSTRVRDAGKHSSQAIMDRTLEYLEQVKEGEDPYLLMCQFKAPHRHWGPDWDLIDHFEETEFAEPETLHDDYETRTTAARQAAMRIKDHMSLDRDLKFATTAPKPEGEGDMNVPFYEERKAEFEKLNPEGEALTEWKYQAYMQDYLACIKGIDRQVGRLLDYLENNDMLENTLIGYSSDQGFYLGEHGWFDKRFMYEESFRTPLILSWPGQIEPGSVNTDLVQNIDMAPTFLELAGMEVPKTMQGRSLLPLFDPETKPADWRQSLYYHYYEYPGAHSVRKHEGAFDGRYKLIRFYGQDVPGEEEWELYDLEKDPLEVHNVVNDPDYQGTREKMEQELRRLQKLYEVPQG